MYFKLFCFPVGTFQVSVVDQLYVMLSLGGTTTARSIVAAQMDGPRLHVQVISLNVCRMFPECSLNITECSLNITEYFLNVP
jgi:hypothetical protein